MMKKNKRKKGNKVLARWGKKIAYNVCPYCKKIFSVGELFARVKF